MNRAHSLYMLESGQHLRAGRRGRILVIDDEPFVARALGLFLGDEHDVVVVTDARDAMARMVAGETFDAILCDVMMPVMSGLEFYDAMEEKYPACVGRIVFITGGAFTAQARAFLARIPNECIDKPPDPFALRAMMRRRVAAIDVRDTLVDEVEAATRTTHVG